MRFWTAIEGGTLHSGTTKLKERSPIASYLMRQGIRLAFLYQGKQEMVRKGSRGMEVFPLPHATCMWSQHPGHGVKRRLYPASSYFSFLLLPHGKEP